MLLGFEHGKSRRSRGKHEIDAGGAPGHVVVLRVGSVVPQKECRMGSGVLCAVLGLIGKMEGAGGFVGVHAVLATSEFVYHPLHTFNRAAFFVRIVVKQTVG